MLNGGLNDYKGLYLGENTTNDAMLFDQFMLNDKRKNHNQIIIGTSGSGKSTLTKKEIAFHLNMGRTVIVIDPEREYQNLCNYYKGQWIDIGNATIGRINPLQVLDNNFKELDEATTENFDEINEAPVSNHLRTLTQWFRTLYHDLKERELRVLINEIQKTYTKFQITNATDISKLKPGQFPTFQNLYETICHSYQEKPNKTLNELMDIIQYDFCNDGQYSKLWNGHTTLNFNNQFVVYDVWTLFDQDIPKIIAAQLYLVLAFIKGEVKRNRFKKDKELIIVIDEAHLAIDKDNPVALNFMYQMVKRCRKYHAGIIITTQNINDFTGTEDIKKKTTAMINNTQYTFIFNLAPSDLNDVKLLYQSYGGLSPEETDFIQRAGKGDALMIVHSYERYCLNISILNSEFKAFDNIK